MFWAQTLIESVDEEYLSCALKFKTLGSMSKKLWPNMLLFFHKWTIWVDKTNHFFQKQKFEIHFLHLYMCGKL